MHLTALSFAYPGVSASDRAGILEPRLPADEIDVFVLATCLRVELAWAGGPDLAPTVLDQLYGSRALPSAKLRTDLDAFHHLARVAAGLESAQVGEAEVLSQFRQALEQLAGQTSADSELVREMEAALGVARTARRSLSDSHGRSLAVAAAHLVDSLPDVLVLGAGAMGRAVVRELDRSKVAVYARRSEPVAGIPSRPWEGLPAVLASCRAVVSTIPGPVPVLQELQRPEGNPLLLIDLGMPPAVEEPDPSALTYRGIDDVAFSMSLASEPEAEATVAIESEKTWGRLTVSREAGSIISSVVALAEQTVDDEVRRFAGAFSASEEPEQVLRQLAHTVGRRIIHPAVSLLGSTPLSPGELDVLAKAFGVERD
jgi:glutamyl-tRNA reductase